MENEVLNEIEQEENTNIDEILIQKDEEAPEELDSTTNCLALTVKEDYHIVVFKNFIRKSARISWKIALSIFTMNFLNMFL